jgi:hypothetical protein
MHRSLSASSAATSLMLRVTGLCGPPTFKDRELHAFVLLLLFVEFEFGSLLLFLVVGRANFGGAKSLSDMRMEGAGRSIVDMSVGSSIVESSPGWP